MKDEHVKDAAQDVAEELELELIQSRMAQKPMLRGEVFRLFRGCNNYLAHRHLPAAEPTPGLPLGDT